MEKMNKININTVTGILLLLGVLVMINLVSIYWFTRLDLTEGKIFTLAKASKDVVKKLPDRMTVKCYFSKDLPAPLSSNARYVRDQLEEYRANSNGNFFFEFKDPGSEEELEKEAQSYRIPPFQVNVVQADKVELKKVYMGMVFLYGDKTETIPVVQQTSGLEYDITSTIKKIVSDKIPKIGFLQGDGEVDIYSAMSNLSQSLQKNYMVQTVDLSGGKMVPEDLDALLIVAPQSTFSEWAMFAIDQYIMKGGKVGFFINMVEANLQEARANRKSLNISDFTQNYGFRINADLVVDQKCGMINIQQRQLFFTYTTSVPYPFFPIIRDFDKKSTLVKDLEAIGLFFPSSIDSIAPTAGASFNFTPLAWTSEKSNRISGRFDINPTSPGFSQQEFPMAEITVAATVMGTFHSYFDGKPVPVVEGGEPFSGELKTLSPETRIFVVGDGNFPQDAYLGNRTNADFFMNVVDWLAQDESLIQIRTRDVTDRPLADISEGLKRLTKYANIFLPVLIVILIGVIRWQIRRKTKLEI
jgi:gliding-associated putative ABC transporter substrate-binding component GldG